MRSLPRQGTLLIDAHNVCYQDQQLRALLHPDAERARQALERRIIRPQRVVLVYDGGPGGQARRLTRANGLRVVYSGQREGDSALLAEIKHLPAPVCVVTDDRALASAAQAQGAQVRPVSAFLAWLQGREYERELAPEAPPSPEEIALWEKLFGA